MKFQLVAYPPSARIVRTFLKVPILAVGLELYDDKTDTAHTEVRKRQWLDAPSMDRLAGKNVLIVDEVDDTRRTLVYVKDSPRILEDCTNKDVNTDP